MRKSIVTTLALALFASIAVHADTVSFVPATSGSLNTTTKTYSGIVATAFYYNGSSWVSSGTGLSLYGRNETNDHGLGICDPLEFNSGGTNLCGTSTGNGDYNEISNEKAKEMLQLTLPTGASWTSVQLSSLDGNSQTNTALYERGTIWASNSSNPGSGLVQVCNFVAFGGTGTCFGSTTSQEPTIAIGSQFANYKYLYFQANDWTGGGNTNNDFTVMAATVPEPASLLLLGCGISCLGALLRKRR